MIVYSKKILLFINEINRIVKVVLAKEAGLRVGRDRFYNRRQNVSYPIKIVVYNNKSMLGYFDPSFYELGFHECLMHTKKEQLHNVVRHELAHYLTFIEHGETLHPHAGEFKAICRQLGWGEEVYRATICLEGAQNALEIEESAVLRKVHKLMALAKSANENEAEQAMIKSRQLLLKHNIESKYVDNGEDEKVVLKRILKQKRENAKMRSIAQILETFFVSTVYSRATDYIYLEILGSEVNVEIAEYVAGFLENELENLWDQAQLLANFKGMVAKNSFFLGLAMGYCKKVQALKREYNKETVNALMVIEKKLTDAKAMAYRRLSSSKSSGNYCRESSALGEAMGRKLNIHPSINKSSNNSTTLLDYDRT